MKKKAGMIGFALFALLSIEGNPQRADSPVLRGPYLGQKPPGMTPEIFAPGILPKEGHQAKLFFTPDGSEAIYDERDPSNNKNRFIWMRSSRGVWSKPAVIPFSTEYINNEPCLSPDGKKLFFVSNRPAVPGGEAERTPDIWMSERTEDGWGDPQRLGPTVNTPDVEVQPYFSSDGKLYFMRQSGDGRQLLCASFQDGQFLEPISLVGNIPPDQVSGPCLSPDNRVVILHSRMEGGFGNWDLYASFKDAAGNWGKLVNLGKAINTEGSEGNATFSPDGKFLFFSRNGDIFWVSSRIIEELRQSYFPRLAGPYLGQKPPGMTPEVFAPGIVSSAEFIDFKGAFSPDGQEYYFYRHALPKTIPTLLFSKVENGIWTEPEPLKVAQGASTYHPCVSPDNQWLFFFWQFQPEQHRPSGFYASARTPAGWSEPEYSGPGMYLTCDRSGRFFTTDSVWGDQPKHYLASMTFSQGRFSRPERLAIQPHYENQTHPCIAPDGSYIIFDINVENGSLFVSFKGEDGRWGEGIDLTKHGFKPNTRGAYISPDGKYLFFSVGGDIWWVDIQVIERLRPR